MIALTKYYHCGTVRLEPKKLTSGNRTRKFAVFLCLLYGGSGRIQDPFSASIELILWKQNSGKEVRLSSEVLSSRHHRGHKKSLLVAFANANTRGSYDQFYLARLQRHPKSISRSLPPMPCRGRGHIVTSRLRADHLARRKIHQEHSEGVWA